ncbi:hypothetical protein [Stenotrophomonas rhizophila]|uniref:hypothetical protein n=1 Tax=Stenotrophomonas rhizophila TaxID=216778 RepID=UPI001AEC4133|nr:hypothetical protein [Stenotrophomonas rhizophila]
MTIQASNHDHIGMAFEPPALYVPTNLFGSELAYLHTVLPVPEGAEFEFLLNGAEGLFPGLSLIVVPTAVALRVDHRFLENYVGPWPAVVVVRYLKEGRPADLVQVQLRNLLTADVATLRVDLLNSPATIPPEGQLEFVQTNPRVFDADMIPLPFGYGTEIRFLDHAHGIYQSDNTFAIDSEATPGRYRVQVTGPKGLEQIVEFVVRGAGEK